MSKLRDNGLTIALMALFLFSFVGQTLAGWNNYNDEQKQRHEPQVSVVEYAKTGNYVESVFENWESEFLQMAIYVVLTAMLFQVGSPESNDPNEEESEEENKVTPESPWPVHKGGMWLWLYERSLALTLFVLFVASMFLHAWGGVREYNADQSYFHQPTITFLEYLVTARFWFESFQNWQSEFLSVAALLVLSIFLRQKRSPQSKPVPAPHSQTGV
jgi:hypothetical protein